MTKGQNGIMLCINDSIGQVTGDISWSSRFNHPAELRTDSFGLL
jgi:hypothetical protein